MATQTDPAPVTASPSSRPDHSPSCYHPGKPPPLGLSPEQVEQQLQAAKARAASNSVRTSPKPSRAAFDAVLEQVGGNLEHARAIVAQANREQMRDRQRREAIFSFETPEEAAARHSMVDDGHRRRLLAASGIPVKYGAASLASFDHLPDDCRAEYEQTVSALVLAAERPGAVIGLCGIRGPGKTYMACALVRNFCQSLRAARYAVTLDYLRTIMREYRPGGDVDAAEKRFRDPQLLVLDEIQVRPDTPAQANQLTSLIDARHRDDKVTILVGNLDEAGLQECVGDSIKDRFHDGGGILECRWPSLRGRI